MLEAGEEVEEEVVVGMETDTGVGSTETKGKVEEGVRMVSDMQVVPAVQPEVAVEVAGVLLQTSLILVQLVATQVQN